MDKSIGSVLLLRRTSALDLSQSEYVPMHIKLLISLFFITLSSPGGNPWREAYMFRSGSLVANMMIMMTMSRNYQNLWYGTCNDGTLISV